MRIDLTGQAAIVTGAARGNGAAIAHGLAAAGAKVALGDVLDASAVAAETGGLAHALDVTDPASCAAFTAAAEAAHGPASILVNNAGIIHRDPVDAPAYAETWDRTLRVNVDGTRNMVLAALPGLRATKGRIVNLGSIMSFRGAGTITAYAASKGAIAQFTRALAVELAPDGIRVNAIAPGVIATPMTEATRANPTAIAAFLAHTPMARVGEAEELVGPVLFLASDLSSYITGTVLPVDGGYLAL